MRHGFALVCMRVINLPETVKILRNFATPFPRLPRATTRTRALSTPACSVFFQERLFSSFLPLAYNSADSDLNRLGRRMATEQDSLECYAWVHVGASVDCVDYGFLGSLISPSLSSDPLSSLTGRTSVGRWQMHAARPSPASRAPFDISGLLCSHEQRGPVSYGLKTVLLEQRAFAAFALFAAKFA